MKPTTVCKEFPTAYNCELPIAVSERRFSPKAAVILLVLRIPKTDFAEDIMTELSEDMPQACLRQSV